MHDLGELKSCQRSEPCTHVFVNRLKLRESFGSRRYFCSLDEHRAAYAARRVRWARGAR